MTSSEDTFDMSDDVFEESDTQTVGNRALNVDEWNSDRTGYPGYKPPKEALQMYETKLFIVVKCSMQFL